MKLTTYQKPPNNVLAQWANSLWMIMMLGNVKVDFSWNFQKYVFMCMTARWMAASHDMRNRLCDDLVISFIQLNVQLWKYNLFCWNCYCKRCLYEIVLISLLQRFISILLMLLTVMLFMSSDFYMRLLTSVCPLSIHSSTCIIALYGHWSLRTRDIESHSGDWGKRSHRAHLGRKFLNFSF